MIDIVYVLGVRSKFDNNEIRYSLRSIEKHLKSFGNVYIIGQLPDFLKDVRHIFLDDDHWCKETNIYNKVLRACQENSISDQFLFFNDDHFLNRDYTASEFPFYYRGDIGTLVKKLEIKRPNNKYSRCCKRTWRVLRALNLPTKMFDVHTPIIYDKKKFIEVMTKYDWGYKLGFIAKSLYANSLSIEGVKEYDCKINAQLPIDEMKRYVERRGVWSIGDNALGQSLDMLLKELYPNPSRWERA